MNQKSLDKKKTKELPRLIKALTLIKENL